MRRYRWLEKSMFALGKQQECIASASNIVVCDYNHLFIDGVREASLLQWINTGANYSHCG